MTDLGVPPAVIRVPPDGLMWLAETCARGDREVGHSCGGMPVPAGVTFDAFELPCATARSVMRWMIENKRHLGPVALDVRAGRTRFLIPPGTGVLVPDVVAEVINAGDVRLPARATTGEALLRWLIVPRSRQPRLTDPADLLSALAASLSSPRRLVSPGRAGSRGA